MTIKKRNILRVTTDYARLLPGWHILFDDAIYRVKDCVLQGIAFNRSSGDDYTPLGYIRVMTAPCIDTHGMEMTHDIKYPNGASRRRVRLMNHENERDLIFNEICQHIRPSVLQPLDAEEVLVLYEHYAEPSFVQAYSLATLNAYLGYDQKAFDWIKQFRQLADGLHLIWNESIASKYWFVEALSMWLHLGIARQKLEAVVLQERTRLGISDSP